MKKLFVWSLLISVLIALLFAPAIFVFTGAAKIIAFIIAAGIVIAGAVWFFWYTSLAQANKRTLRQNGIDR